MQGRFSYGRWGLETPVLLSIEKPQLIRVNLKPTERKFSYCSCLEVASFINM